MFNCVVNRVNISRTNRKYTITYAPRHVHRRSDVGTIGFSDWNMNNANATADSSMYNVLCDGLNTRLHRYATIRRPYHDTLHRHHHVPRGTRTLM